MKFWLPQYNLPYYLQTVLHSYCQINWCGGSWRPPEEVQVDSVVSETELRGTGVKAIIPTPAYLISAIVSRRSTSPMFQTTSVHVLPSSRPALEVAGCHQPGPTVYTFVEHSQKFWAEPSRD